MSHALSFVLLGVTTLAITFLGSVMALPGAEKKPWQYGTFVVLVILGVVFTMWAGVQTETDRREAVKAQKTAEDNSKKTQAKLDAADATAKNTQDKLDMSLREQADLSGQLKAYGNLLEQIKQSDDINWKEVAASIKEQAAKGDVCGRAIDLAGRMRRLGNDTNHNVDMVQQEGSTPAQRKEEENEIRIREKSTFAEEQQEELHLVYSELLKRLKVPKPDIPPAAKPTILGDMILSPDALPASADYLELLAKDACR